MRLKVCVDTDGIKGNIEDLAGYLFLAAVILYVCYHPWETFWWMVNELTPILWWAIVISGAFVALCIILFLIIVGAKIMQPKPSPKA
jgi:hypothetical protein